MAVVQYGSLITELKGSVGGNVFQAGNNCKVLRNKGYRKGASSSRRLLAGRNLTNAASAWKTLDQSSRDAWSATVGNWPFIDRYGNAYIGSGYQVYCAYSAALKSLGLPYVANPNSPVEYEVVNVTSVVLDDSGYMNVNTDISTIVVQSMQIFASMPMSNGRNSNNVRYKLIATFLTNESSGVTLPTEYVSAWGVPQVSSKVVVKCVLRVNDYPIIVATFVNDVTVSPS